MRLHELGLRSTPARRAVLDVVGATSDHLSAEDIARRVVEQSTDIHRSTVFRTLHRLVSLGVLDHIHLPHGATTYHVHDSQERMHLHLACRSCGTVVDLDPGSLDHLTDELRHQMGLELEPAHSALSGTCATCVAGAVDRRQHDESTTDAGTS